MNELSNRCLAIIRLMLDEQGFVTIKYIADTLHVSVRTVKYDLDKIRWWMKDNGIRFISLPKKGVMIEESDKEDVWHMIDFEGNDYFFSSDERVTNLIYYFLTSYQGESLDEIAQNSNISKNTMLRDMEKVEKWFQEHGIIIRRKQKKGISFSISESDVRRLLVELIVENKNINESIEYYAFKNKISAVNIKSLEIENEIAKTVKIDEIVGLIEKFLNNSEYHISDVNMIYLIYFSLVQRFRIANGHYIRTNLNAGLGAVKQIYDRLCDVTEFVDSFDLPAFRKVAEITYISKIIHAYIDGSSVIQKNADFTEIIYNEVVRRVLEITHCDISKDIDVSTAMKLHISSMINRISIKVPYRNVMLDDIKERYKDSYNLADAIFTEISEKYNIEKYDDEIGFIAIYLNQALDRIFKDTENFHYVNTILICSQGHARVSYLVKSLQERFNRIKIIDKISVFRMKDYNFDDVDLILTTIELPFPVIKPVIKVNPILNKRDIDKIETFLNENIGSSFAPGNKELLVNDLIRVIGQYYDIDSNFKLKEEIRLLIGSDNKPLPNLVRVLKSEYITCKIDAYDWEDAVIQSAEPLLRYNTVDGKYLDEIFTMKNRDGQYAIVAPGICMPHASPNNRNKLSLSLATLKNPISIPCDNGTTEINTIMVLAINDNIRYSRAIDELFTMFTVYPDFSKLLNEAKDNKELIEVLKTCYDKVEW